MPSFSPPVVPADQLRLADLELVLPDPPRGPAEPVNRPGVARYAGATVTMLHLMAPRLGDPSTSLIAFELLAPATGAVRRVDLGSGTADPALEAVRDLGPLIEISPLPFGIEGALRRFRQGLPTFYLSYGIDSAALIPVSAAEAVVPADDTVVTVGESFGFVTELAIGVLFQDRTTLSPRTWIELVGRSLDENGETEAAADWNAMLELFAADPVRTLRVIDAAGRPAAGQIVRIGNAATDDRASDAEGNIDVSDLTDDLTVEWLGDPADGDETLPVLAVYETGASAARDPLDQGSVASLVLPEASVTHLQVLDLSRWFAPRSEGVVQMPRFRLRSRVEPLVDGLPTFRRLVDDLLASAAPGCGAQFAGWAFEDFTLVPGLTGEFGEPVDSGIVALSARIRAAGGDVRFLVNDLVMIRDAQALEQIVVDLAATALIAGTLGTVASGFMVTSGVGLITTGLGIPVLAAGNLILFGLSPAEIVEKIGELSGEFFEAINTVEPARPNVAILSPYPATVDDNPERRTQEVFIPLHGTVDFEPAINQFGTYHQKIQLIKRDSPDSDANRFIAYVGGIDIDRTRVDDPGHQGRATLESGDPTALNRLVVAPFHDVHARLTGPTVIDVFRTWDQRYALDREHPERLFDPGAPSLEPVISVAEVEAANLGAGGGDHAVQIGRTYYRGAVGPNAFENFAPLGETTTVDTLIRAIEAATEYIYIEDQYFTPNARDAGSPAGSESVKTYFDALVDAADRCRRLLILVPAETTQLFGDLRRRHLFELLRAAWTDRLLVGVPLRRPFLPHAGRTASVGRCVLSGAIDASESMLRLSPPSRVPGDAPYWLWIDGELMLARQVVPLGSDATEIEVQVERGTLGTDPRWGASARAHLAGAPVTLSQHQGIYVHSKITIVDDVFVGIGSSNANRRGFHHDGEIHAFAVPQALKAATDNPARSLRTSLWAEHLGLPPSMGDPLVEDPIAAFELFRRSFYEGNRFVGFEALDVQAALGTSVSTGTMGLVLAALGAPALLPDIRTLWDDASDPTSFSDLAHSSGPVPET